MSRPARLVLQPNTVPRSQALAEIRRVAGTQLDLDACRALHHLFEEPWIETDGAVASTGG